MWFVVLRHSVDFKFKQYRITINFWFLIIFLLIQAGLNELGYWQLSRAQEKQARLEILSNNQEPILTSLEQVDQSFVDNFGFVQLDLELAEQVNLLVENKIQKGKLGYHVLNLVQDSSSNRYLLINRGRKGARANRKDIPAVDLPSREWKVTARVYQINEQVLSGGAEIENHGKVLRLPVLDLHIKQQLENRFNVLIEPYILRLEEDTAASFDINWEWINMRSEERRVGKEC